MKRKLLLLGGFLTSSVLLAQQNLPHSQDYEGETIGADVIGSSGTTDFYTQDHSGDLTTPTTEIANGANGTKVIYKNVTAFNFAPEETNTNEKNHYLRTPAFHATAGSLYNISLDINASNGNLNFRIQGKDAQGDYTTIDVANSVISSSSPEVTSIDQSKGKVRWTSNTQIKVNIAYTAPAGYVAFRVQFYQFGTNSYELDNLSIVDAAIANTTSFEKNTCSLQSTLVKDELTVNTTEKIQSFSIIDMTGVTYLVKTTANNAYNVSSLKPGTYIACIQLENGSKENIQFVKQ